MSIQEKNCTVKATVISCVEAPRLNGVYTRQFFDFKRLRDLYEKQIKEKARHIEENIFPTY